MLISYVNTVLTIENSVGPVRLFDIFLTFRATERLL